jgi:hypothetical protein
MASAWCRISWSFSHVTSRCHGFGIGSFLLLAASPATLIAQQTHPAASPIATVSVQDATVQGVVSQQNGLAELANNGAITAGEHAAKVTLARGGDVLVCTGTTIHIAKDIVPHAASQPGDAGLLISLDHGAIEGHYTPGAFADEILTPDLRLLVSQPGVANLKLRVSSTGDTCVDNAGTAAPYVVASSLMNGGIYRIQPGQRVLFVHGSLTAVVDNEHEPCGCPPAASGDPNAFPLAVSEGLKPPPRLSGPPVVPEGTPLAQVTATFSDKTPPGAPPAAESPAAARPKQQHRGLFGRIGHFFAHVFGADG